MKHIRIDIDSDGIATILLNHASEKMNLVSPEWLEEMDSALNQVKSNQAIKGVLITSGKTSFMAGADLKVMGAAYQNMTTAQAFALSQHGTAVHRKLETSGKPFVAALNGLALGGGFELALACHYRVLVDNPKAIVGLPEVTVGLLPGSGGTQRLARMIGVEKALPLLLEGTSVDPAKALALGLVDAIVPAQSLLSAAKAWLLSAPNPVRAWDQKGFSLPESGGLLSPSTATLFAAHAARLAARGRHRYPAPIAILAAVFEGVQVPFDKSLLVESRYFAKLLIDPIARNIIRTSFLSKQAADKLARRPSHVPPSTIGRLGVLGAGLMGAGIAHAAAVSGMSVVLLDRTSDAAAKGKSYSAKVLAKEVERDVRRQQDADLVLDRISTTTEFGDLARCDLIIEAVFEDMAIKADVTKRAEAVIASTTVFASNTSTLPITALAEASERAQNFIGLHFFSPVERMPLVEVILGRKTSQETLARSLDFIKQMRKTPIIVNDSRGFFTSRVFQTFIHEGAAMLGEGIAAERIENAAKSAGLPLGPLALLDETNIELSLKVVDQAVALEGPTYQLPCGTAVMRQMKDVLQRTGRSAGGGFYEYPATGRKRLWSGLKTAFPLQHKQPQAGELEQRLLYIQALETARCLDEGVLTHPADGDVGALLGWNYPQWTGGPLSLIETIGLTQFVSDCDRLAANFGARFSVPASLRSRADQGHMFYEAPLAGSGAA